MKTFKQYLEERCWTGYKPVPGKKAYSKGSCVKEDGGAGGAAGAAGGGMSVAGVAGTGDSRLPSSQREPGVSKKRNPVLGSMNRRKPPKI